MTDHGPRAADQVAIQSVLVRQKLDSDAREIDALRHCYTDDFELTTSFNGAPPTVAKGVEAVLAQIKAGWDRGDDGGPQLMHFVGPAAITPLTNDRARARSSCLYVATATGAIVGWGDYCDDLVCVAGEWKLSARNVAATFLEAPITSKR